ncbi:sigma-70 family RNA polymerase sigma factor [Streptomyces sp. NPDC093065]|uniref:sigma-70 family RNA polymerase sigma factor n=1 Tax=Streptomyces sp. NPDC093065 TaxID=3366021 RepID=UPI003800E88D
MVLRTAGEAGSPGMKAVLGQLLAGLRQAAVQGVVPESAFLEGVRALSLGDGERERLRTELGRLGLPVRDMSVHTESDKRNGEKVAPNCEENVSPRLRSVRHLLERYADSDGCVTMSAVDGVARLAGLTTREAAVLRAEAPVRGRDLHSEGSGATDASEGAAADPRSSQEAESAGDDLSGALEVGAEHEESDPELTPDLPRGDLADAVAAAHAVLARDRRERRPGARLLDAQAEVGLAVLLRGGPDRIAEEPTDDDLRALAPEDLRIRARDCLVVHNQRLVHSLVRPHLEQGLDYDDLLQHGFLGLLRAARKFDATKGFKFSTYATWWIRQAITRAIADEGALIRIPVHMHEQMRKVARAERNLAGEGRPATAADVAVACDMALQKVEEIRRLTRRTDSLDRVIGDGATLADFVGRTHTVPSVEQQVVGDQYMRDVLGVVDTFTEREARILVRRLGLDGDDPLTLDELGREFGVTRERIRQIEGKARPALRERLRQAGLAGGDAVSEAAERRAAEAAEAVRLARFERATRAARATRARLALRKVRAQRLARTDEERRQDVAVAAWTGTAEEREEDGGAPIDVAGPEIHGVVAEEDSARGETAGETGETGGAEASDLVVADWEQACRLAQAPVDQISWLANYARVAVGDEGLVDLLGQPAAEIVTRYAGDGAPLPRPVLTALEVLRRVFDAVAMAGQRPEDFFDRPAEALRGAVPRTYLKGSPLVSGESRLAVRDALREFLAVATPRAEPEPLAEGRDTEPSAEGGDAEPLAGDRDAEPSTEGRGSVQKTEGRPAEQESRTPGTERPVGQPQSTADWDMARMLTQPPLGGGVAWLAEYALLALGHLQLSVLLGPSVTESVVRAARQRGVLDRPVVEALEVLKEVLDTVKRWELRPEHFFEWPANALAGVTPRAYLATKPLVRAVSRLAVRDALGEFVAVRPGTGSVLGRSPDKTSESSAQAPTDAEEPLASAEIRHQAELAQLAQEHERRLGGVRSAADERVAAVRADAERRLDALEEELLHRADRALDRREAHVRSLAEARVAHLKEQHREAHEALLRRAERAEEAAREAAVRDRRAAELEHRLREYRESAEARIRDLEARLRKTEEESAERERAAASSRQEYRQGVQVRVTEMETRLGEAEAAVAQRDLFVAAARKSAEETEQQAAQRIAQSEHDAWLRITDLQTQLSTVQAELAAAQEEAAQSRTSLRDRWRRS